MTYEPSPPSLKGESGNNFEKIIVLTHLFFAASANQFSRSLDSWAMPAAPLLFVLIHVVFSWRKRIKFTRSYYYVICGYVVYSVLVGIKFEAFHPRFIGIYFIYLHCSYITLQGMREKYFYVFEWIVSKLAVVSLIMWALQIAAPSMVRKILVSLELFPSIVTLGGVNGIIYTIQNTQDRIPRNCGFAWEPGGFAAILVFAIFTNLLRNNLQISSNKNLIILFVSLMTTQSTTGWIACAILLLWFAINQKMWPIWIGLSASLIVFAYFHPVMGEKITQLLEEDGGSDIQESVNYAYYNESVYLPQRFASLRIALEEFQRNPILGYGGHVEESFSYRMNVSVIVVNGIGEILRRFGLFGMLFFVANSIRSSLNFPKIFGRRQGKWVLMAVTFSVAFSYSQILLPLFCMFWLSGSFLNVKNGIEKE